ncbi:MAG: DUF937 domain-containing protein [Novosphingobium sp.]
MNLNDVLPAGAIDAIAGQLGLPHDQAKRGVEALLPSIVHGMGQGGGGGGALDSIVSALGGGALADNVVDPQPTDVSKGNELLGSIFGSKDVSRQVAGEAAQHTGIDPALLKKMLPILAMLVAGYLSKRSSAQGDGGGLGGLLGPLMGALAGAQGGGGSGAGLGGLGSVLGSILGGRR